MAVLAKREYVAAFRRSIQQQDVQPAEIRLDTADLNTIETLVTELSHPDPRRVIYAVDLLESLDKRHLVTPLLLHHESPQVRARALAGGGGRRPRSRVVLAPRRRARDEGHRCRRCGSLPYARWPRSTARTPPSMMRGFLSDPDPVMVVTAACALAEADSDADRTAAEDALRALASDTREQAAPVRAEVARALGDVPQSAIPAAAGAVDVRRRSRRRA